VQLDSVEGRLDGAAHGLAEGADDLLVCQCVTGQFPAIEGARGGTFSALAWVYGAGKVLPGTGGPSRSRNPSTGVRLTSDHPRLVGHARRQQVSDVLKKRAQFLVIGSSDRHIDPR